MTENQIDAIAKNEFDTTQFNETPVIKSLKSKRSTVAKETDRLRSKDATLSPPGDTKLKRGRKCIYSSDEERILARRSQQKAYRERRKKELIELRELKNRIEAEQKNTE